MLPGTRQTRGHYAGVEWLQKCTPQLIGKQAHRWEDVQKGLMNSRDEVETLVHAPEADAWTEVVIPFFASTRRSGLRRLSEYQLAR